MELEVVGVFECVYTCSPLLLYFFWFVASYPDVSSLVLGPITTMKRPFDLNMHMCLSVDIRGLPSLSVCAFLSALSDIDLP